MLSHQHSTLSPHPKHLICHYRTLVDAINHIQPSHIQQSLWNGTAPRNLSVHCSLCGCHPLFNETSNCISSPWPNDAQYRGGSSYRENGWQVSRSALHKCVLSWWWLPGCHLTEGSLVSGPSYAVSHFELSLFLMYTFSCFSNKSLVDSSPVVIVFLLVIVSLRFLSPWIFTNSPSFLCYLLSMCPTYLLTGINLLTVTCMLSMYTAG